MRLNIMNKKYDELLIPEKYFAIQALHGQLEVLRLAAVVKLSNQEVLETVALKDTSSQVRLKAVERLDNESVLQQIACSDQASDVALAACRRLKKPTSLQEVARCSVHWETRLFALQQDTFSQDQLIYLILTDASPDVRSAAISKLQEANTLENLLEHVVQTDPTPLVRQQAVLKLSSPEKLTQIFESEQELSVRKAVIENPHTTLSFLSEKLEDITNAALRLTIIQRLTKEITDPDILQQVVLIDPRTLAESVSDPNMQLLIDSIYTALKRLPPEAHLSIIQKSPSSIVRARAVSLIKDPAVLEDLARQESSSEVKIAIIENSFVSPETLLNFAKSDSRANIRFAAVCYAGKQIKDSSILAKFVKMDPHQLEQKNTKYSAKRFTSKLVEIVSAIDDQDNLVDISLEAPASAARAAAIEKVQKSNIINEIALKDGSPSVRISAIRNPLISQQTLLQVLSQDLDFRVCQNAVDYLQDEMLLAKFSQKPIEKGEAGFTERLMLRAVRRVTSQKILGQIALSAALPIIRQEAIKLVDDVQVLTDISLKTLEIADGQLTLKKLRSSKQHLAAIRLSAKLKPLRNLARQKLEQLA
ncbi:MAG: hypothetical protein ACFFCZ_04430 [Promethearchaeota archaeon]